MSVGAYVHSGLAAFILVIVVTLILPLTGQTIPQTKPETTPKKPKILRQFPLGKFYDTAIPLPPGKAGALIRSEVFEEYDLPPGVNAVRILYHSRSSAGEDVASSAVVLFPDAKAPAGGWPIIAWAHGWNGIARQCAPSLARNIRHGTFLSMYVNLGYAVVAADYTGLGTAFRNAFVDMQSNATDVLYSVPAARSAVPELGSRWVAIGEAEGGMAVVGLAELTPDMRDADYLGGIVISNLYDLQDRYVHGAGGSSLGAPLFLAYGIRTVYPQFEVKDMLADKALPLYQHIEQTCGELEATPKLAPGEMLKPNWEDNQYVKQYFQRNRPGEKPAYRPLLVASSDADPAGTIRNTEKIVARMCKRGDQVQFERYAELDPGRVIGDSARVQISWIQARFANGPVSDNCSEQH